AGLGAKVYVYAGGQMQLQEENPVRGYFSSVDRQLLFGLGSSRRVDSVRVIWPDSSIQTKTAIAADTFITLTWKDAVKGRPASRHETLPIFSDITSTLGITYRHQENSYNDFAPQRLLPHKYSQLGPFIATGDVN